MNIGIKKSITIGGKEISVETGKLAKQADGSVVLQMGNTVLLATAVSSKEAKEGIDFLPLTVDYREKFAAAGRIPGGFLRREARPSDNEVLIMRLVDRALRPLFPDDYHAETQVMIQMMAYDGEHMPDTLAGLAASAALSVSDIPFHGPISEVRVARIDNAFKINPTVTELEKADMDLIVAASMDNIMMVEGEMKEIQEEDLLEALKVAHQAIKTQCQVQLDLAAEVEKANPKREYCHENNDEELRERLKKETYQKIYDIAKNPTSKHERSEAFEKVLDDFLESIPEDEREEKTPMIKRYYDKVQWEAVRNMVLSERQRLDGRKLD